jgi:cytochrome c peroxidase
MCHSTIWATNPKTPPLRVLSHTDVLPSITICKKDSTTGLLTSTCKMTTDLGQALIDGNFDHAGKIKGPILRGLSSRAPYFHNGSAQTLLDVVRFYENRFNLKMINQEESDLVAFLSAL